MGVPGGQLNRATQPMASTACPAAPPPSPQKHCLGTGTSAHHQATTRRARAWHTPQDSARACKGVRACMQRRACMAASGTPCGIPQQCQHTAGRGLTTLERPCRCTSIWTRPKWLIVAHHLLPDEAGAPLLCAAHQCLILLVQQSAAADAAASARDLRSRPSGRFDQQRAGAGACMRACKLDRALGGHAQGRQRERAHATHMPRQSRCNTIVCRMACHACSALSLGSGVLQHQGAADSIDNSRPRGRGAPAPAHLGDEPGCRVHRRAATLRLQHVHRGSSRCRQRQRCCCCRLVHRGWSLPRKALASELVCVAPLRQCNLLLLLVYRETEQAARKQGRSSAAQLQRSGSVGKPDCLPTRRRRSKRCRAEALHRAPEAWSCVPQGRQGGWDRMETGGGGGGGCGRAWLHAGGPG